MGQGRTGEQREKGKSVFTKIYRKGRSRENVWEKKNTNTLGRGRKGGDKRRFNLRETRIKRERCRKLTKNNNQNANERLVRRKGDKKESR